jgi:hypothetical protein
MNRSYGTMPMTKPEGMLRQLHFTSLCRMDEMTGDNRILDSAGAGVRELPRTIYGAFTNSGHDGAAIIGALHSVTFHDDGNVSGDGWILDDDNGRQAVSYIAAGALRHNSVDLAECKVGWDLTDDADDDMAIVMKFHRWNIAATTLVGNPAFADTTVELVAGLETDDTPLDVPAGAFVLELTDTVTETTASLTATVPWDDFHIPEADRPTKIVVDPDGVVYGHLCCWDSRHDGYPDAVVRPPRPSDNYASFNKSGPMTELGQVETGPIFFAGGHPRKPLGNQDPFEAYGDVTNAWADVRVIPGRFGPWLSGRVRPGIDDATVYAARASRISGHWVGDRLRAIVSVSVEGFDVAGTGFEHLTTASFGTHGELLELVASFLPADEPAVAMVATGDLVDVGVDVAAVVRDELARLADAALAAEHAADAERLVLAMEFD